MATPFILGINGSPNKNGLTASLLKQSLEQSKSEGAKTELVHLIDFEKGFFKGDLKKIEPEIKPLIDLILKSNGFIISTPVYWMNMSALVKNFLDQLTPLEESNFKLEGKVAGFIATEDEGGGWKTVLDLAGPLAHMGVIFPPYSFIFYNRKIAEKSEHDWMEKDIKLLGVNIIKMAKLLPQQDKYFWGYQKTKP